MAILQVVKSHFEILGSDCRPRGFRHAGYRGRAWVLHLFEKREYSVCSVCVYSTNRRHNRARAKTARSDHDTCRIR